MLELQISRLVAYARSKGWIEESDRIWASNRILEALHIHDFDGLLPPEQLPMTEQFPPLQEILDELSTYAYKNGLIAGDSASFFDLFDTELMGRLIPRPSEIIGKFWKLYEKSPREATDWYYTLSGDTNYIRRERIRKDRKWTVPSKYGQIDISINLSKPEKDPKAIAAAAKMKSSSYPKCLLCAENEGFPGSLTQPARQNHRVIPVALSGEPYYLQYSPYVYYNEHCIVFSKTHTPMHIDRGAFDHMLDFVTKFPHYFIGSNADLPIVGGSVLSHDHYQGGRYTFPMARAVIEEEVCIPGFEDVHAGIVKWPMSVLRISSPDQTRVAQLAEHVLDRWRVYDDPDAFIFHETEGVPHSTITPIVRRREDLYEMDLVLRNNITTEEHPLGVFHPHQEKHHIKKENIGLIEVMGLAVLPARLKDEMEILQEAVLRGEDLRADERICKHADWAEEFLPRHGHIDEKNIGKILEAEIGRVFVGVLEDSGVFPYTEKGRESFRKFISCL